MTGACTIESIDIATLGALILRDGDHDLLSFPARKEPILIDWPDGAGFEISDDDPVFDAKKVSIDYYLKGDETNFLSRLNSFANLHFQASADMSVYVREFDLTFALRFTGITQLEINRGISRTGEKSARLTVDYMMDNPVQIFNDVQVNPTANRQPDTQVTLDATDLAAYGIIVKSVYPTALRISAKPGIVYNSRYSTGNDVTYPSAQLKAPQKITIACAMVCDDRAAFMENWNALFKALAVASSTIGLTAAGKSYKAYYNSMESFTKRPWTRRAFAEFDLNFTGYEV